MKLNIVSASYHRNGISGAGFYAILFDDAEQGRMIASLFDEPWHCAVYNVAELAKDNITFAGGNSWRGDNYEEALRPLLKEFLQAKKCAPYPTERKIMKIAMLYRAHSSRPDHIKLAPGLFVRTEIIALPDADDLSDGLDHIQERKGEHFINCVSADSQA